MKKVLLASTAALALGVAAGAQAADPIKLGLGGYSRMIVGYADQDEAAVGIDVNNFDVKMANEVFVLGSTTLDNGIKIAFKAEFEAGGTPSNTADPVDEANVTVTTGFGQFILGAEDNAAYLLHVTAPDASGSLGESDTHLMNWVQPGPAGVTTSLPGAFISTNPGSATGDDEKITYISPSFAGFTVGASYAPTILSEDTLGMEADGADAWALTAAYNNKFGDIGLKAALGMVRGVHIDYRDWAAGVQVGFAGFTVGGGYRKITDNFGLAGGGASIDGRVWDLGVMYAAGPYAVSLSYQNGEAEGLIATAGDDEASVIQVSGKYNLGPGIDWISTLGRVSLDDEAGVLENDGWAVQTGLAMAF